MAFVATRRISIAKRTYMPGQVVPTKALPPGKAEQLVSLRWLRDTDERRAKYVALRAFKAGEKAYKRGDRVDVSTLAFGKLSQLMELRYLEPAA